MSLLRGINFTEDQRLDIYSNILKEFIPQREDSSIKSSLLSKTGKLPPNPFQQESKKRKFTETSLQEQNETKEQTKKIKPNPEYEKKLFAVVDDESSLQPFNFDTKKEINYGILGIDADYSNLNIKKEQEKER